MAKPTLKDQVLREFALQDLNDRLAQSLKHIIAPEQWDDFPIDYYCECSSDSCSSRLALTMAERAATKRDESSFIVFPTHNSPAIERIIKTQDRYAVVRKKTEAIRVLLN